MRKKFDRFIVDRQLNTIYDASSLAMESNDAALPQRQ
jgi:hypothetical protein